MSHSSQTSSACCQSNRTTNTHHATADVSQHPDATAADLCATSQPQPCLATQSADSCSLADLMHVVPELLDTICAESLASLLATSSAHRAQVHGHVKRIVIYDNADVLPLISSSWPRLTEWKLSETDRGRGYWPPDFSLSLSNHRLDSAAIANLVKGDLAQLQYLHTRNGRIDVAATAMLSHRHWPLLQMFELRHAGLASAVESFNATKWPFLEYLDLSKNKLDARAVGILVAISWPKLQHLDLSHNSLDATAVAKLGQGNWPKLRALHLARSEVNEDSLTQLTQAAWPHLRTLDMSTSLGKIDAAAIVQLTQAGWCDLQSLDLSKNGLDSAAISQLSVGNWKKLQNLTLSEAATNEDAISSLVQGNWPMLSHLDLAGNKMYAPALHVLIRGRWPLLTHLFLSVNLQAKGVLQAFCCNTVLHTSACQDSAFLMCYRRVLCCPNGHPSHCCGYNGHRLSVFLLSTESSRTEGRAGQASSPGVHES